MPEEVTYATLKFPDSPKMKTLQESCSQKRADNQEVQELELHGGAETGTERIKSTVKLSESRGQRASSCKRYQFLCISLMLHLVLLASLGTLELMCYQQFILCTKGTSEPPQSITEQLKRNLTLCVEMYNNVSSEHIISKNMSENKIRKLKNLVSQYCKDLKQKRKDPTCSKLWISHGEKCYYFSTEQKNHFCFEKNNSDCTMNHSLLMSINNEMNSNRAQSVLGFVLFIHCLPSPNSSVELNCTLNHES
ncbi:C-type lectin domain family 12 member A-like isoform 1-T1 [Trichechus inunguis]